MKRELFWFGIVGVTAMLVHLGSVSLLLVPLGLSPLVANVLGFLLAFQVSHAGHHKLTFGAAGAPASRSRVRFFLVALLSFVINELMYAALLHFTHLDYRLALAMVLIAVAALTFFSARNWAFASQDQTSA
jgi:putative flippase GtrA